MEKKRVLLISPKELCVGGISTVLLTLIRELHEEYSFDVVTLCDKAGFYDDVFRSYGVKIYKIPSIQYLEHKILYPLSFFQIKKAITKILKEGQYDVIHGHSGWQDAACHLAAAQVGVPVRISHGHGTYARKGKNLVMRSYSQFTKAMIRKYATARLACSSVSGDTLFLGAPYETVLNPVDVAQYADIIKAPHEGIGLLQIGYFCELKNQLFSLKLLTYLRGKGVDARLDFIGYPSEAGYHEKMEQVIAEGELQQFVSFLPRDFDKRTAFAQADYSLLPSEAEGLGIAALESQAAGVPCLMSNHVPKEVNIGAGFFLPHDDLEKWAEAIIDGVEVDTTRLANNLQTISTQAYTEKIKALYEGKRP